MALTEDEAPGGAPEWVVTYGDMMSLLLTFFIMLVSMSEIKSEEQYQALVEAIRRQFGYDTTWKALMPGNQKPRNAVVAKLATMGRALKFDIMTGGSRDPSAVGDHPRVVTIRPGDRSVVGTTITFAEPEWTLSDQQREQLKRATVEMLGKPQVIEIRGHTTRRPAQDFSTLQDNWELAYQRCRAVMQYLTKELGIPDYRLRLVVAADTEPLYAGTQPDLLEKNARVDVFLTDQLARPRKGQETSVPAATGPTAEPPESSQ
ncbi:MAG: MotB protein [Pirellulaceae bacterium]|nr:MAG: MotB protein [Pirellulaceae bacterium]